MRDAKVKKHKKKRTKSDTVFDGDTGRKFPEKPEHSKDMRGEKVKKHKKKRTKSDSIYIPVSMVIQYFILVVSSSSVEHVSRSCVSVRFLKS
jgi:hypothetical protein